MSFMTKVKSDLEDTDSVAAKSAIDALAVLNSILFNLEALNVNDNPHY